MHFEEYQARAHRTATTDDVDIYSLGLIGEAGSVASAIKKFKRDARSHDAGKKDIQEQLGDALWYLTEIGTRFGIALEDIASSNLDKTEFLFVGGAIESGPEVPENEKFPRQLTIRFDDNGSRLQLYADDVQIGDPLTDNAYEDDGYRYHDVFHLGYMTVLGWSPVMRALLQRKRKSRSQVDEIEDGARAKALEEGISIMVFSQSRPISASKRRPLLRGTWVTLVSAF